MGSYLYLCEVYHMQCDSNSKLLQTKQMMSLCCFRIFSSLKGNCSRYIHQLCLFDWYLPSKFSNGDTNSKNTLRSVSCIHRDEAEKTACGTITLSSVCWTVLSCVLLVACNSTVILSTSWYESEVINMSNVLLKCQCGASTCGLQKRHLPTFYPGDVVLFLRVWFCGLCRRFIDDRRCFSKFSHKSSVNVNSAPWE